MAKRNGMFHNCLICSKAFWVKNYLIKIGKGKYCSKECMYKGKKGITPWWIKRGLNNLLNNGRTRFKKGRILSTEIEQKRVSNLPRGENHDRWKGEKVGYHALHDWVRKELGNPIFCSICKIINSNKAYHWANRSGQYKRDLTDWFSLCVSCHKNYDLNRKKEYNNLNQI